MEFVTRERERDRERDRSLFPLHFSSARDLQGSRGEKRERLNERNISLSLSLSLSSPPLPTLSLTPSTRPRLLSSPFPSGTSLRPCHSLPSLSARPPGALSLSLFISIRHRAVRSLPSRGYDASPPSPSPCRDNDESVADPRACFF